MNSRRRIELWLRELRAANLLTVPGDPLAGAMLAAGEAGPSAAGLWPTVAAALALYAAGILDNDLTGWAEDRRLGRPRPLATGEISRASAQSVRTALFAAGLSLAALAGPAAAATAAALASLILTYHRGGSRHPIAGPLLLGLCRALSLGMGAMAQADGGPSARAVVAAAIWCVLIAALAAAARMEAAIPGRSELIGRLLCAWPLVQAIAVLGSGQTAAPPAAGALLLAALLAARLRHRWPPS